MKLPLFHFKQSLIELQEKKMIQEEENMHLLVLVAISSDVALNTTQEN